MGLVLESQEINSKILTGNIFMARYTGPKQRLQRQVGEDLNLKTNALKTAKRLHVKPGQHGHKRHRRLSDYGVQLQEKQKVKYIYGILEKQLKKAYEKASQHRLEVGGALLSLLERRLDNVVYRLGWAPTRAAARQFVAHNHVRVNDKKMNIPSYLVEVDDMIRLKDASTKIPVIQGMLKNENDEVPEWLERKRHLAKVVRLPERPDVTEKIEEQLVVEFYSR